MKMTNRKWAFVGVPIVLVALGTAGVSVASILPLAFLVICPLMMMGMHGGHGKKDEHAEPEKTLPNLHDRES